MPTYKQDILYPEIQALMELDLYDAQLNIDHNALADRQRAITGQVLSPEERARPILIIGGGPSLRENEDGVREGEVLLDKLEARKDGIKVLSGSAHKFIQTGQLSSADIAVFNQPDPKGEHADGTRQSYGDHYDASKDITYILASQCDPRLFEKAEDAGAPIEIFHSYVEDITFPRRDTLIGAGSTAPIAALAVMAAKGYRNFEFYGVDAGAKMNPEEAKAIIANKFSTAGHDEYAYDMPDYTIADDTVIVQVGNDFYSTTQNFWEQHQEMMIFSKHYGQNLNLHSHGFDRLSAALLNEPRPSAYKVYDLKAGTELDFSIGNPVNG